MAENIARTVQIGARVRPEIAEWLKSSQNVSDFLNEILENTFAGNTPKRENGVFIQLTPQQFQELDTLLQENPELVSYENILLAALSNYVFNGLTFGLNENDERLLTPEREAEIRAQFQTLLDENINPLKDEISLLKHENKRLQDENNVFKNYENINPETENIENNPVFMQLQNENTALQHENKRLLDENNVFKNHENISHQPENIENNPVFMQLQNENIALQDENKRLLDENNVFKNHENITTESENIENNPVFIRLQNENKALQVENIRLRDENNENTMLDKFKAFKLANDAGLNNLIAEAVRFSEKKAFVRIGAGVWKKHYTKGFEEISQP